MKMILKLLAGATMAVAAISASGSAEAIGTDKAIVLVHGGFVDGSGWEGVYKILKKDGYDVTIVQNSTI
jgi:triacylglycerol esterase/lipase EstA (alpha/beta hydrolase family)